MLALLVLQSPNFTLMLYWDKIYEDRSWMKSVVLTFSNTRIKCGSKQSRNYRADRNRLIESIRQGCFQTWRNLYSSAWNLKLFRSSSLSGSDDGTKGLLAEDICVALQWTRTKLSRTVMWSHWRKQPLWMLCVLFSRCTSSTSNSFNNSEVKKKRQTCLFHSKCIFFQILSPSLL